MAGFIFGGDTGTSSDDLAKRRKIIDELTKNATARMPRDIGEGIYSLGTSIVGRVKDKKLKPMEDAERARLGGQFDAITSGLMGGQPPMGGTSYAAPMSEADQIGADTMAALGKDPASMVRHGLIDRGLPEHIADGFVMNFQDESGLNPGINEISPIVPGSRGGFGLAQWTGPRRRALESFAASQGKPVSDQDVQLDFLMTELQGPESAAWREISGAQDAGQAGAAIVNSFLRPAEQHRASREARYTGGQGTMSAKNGGGNQSIVSQLVELMQNPYASDSQQMIAHQLLGTQMAQMGPQDPMAGLEMQRAQIGLQTDQLQLDQLRNPNADPMAALELEQAQLNLDQDRAGAGADAATFGTTLQFFTGPNGKTRAGVLGSDGSLREIKPPDGGDWATGIEKVDAGTKWLIYDKRTGQKIGEEEKDIRGAAAEAEIGAAEGKAEVAAPGDMATAETTLGYISSLRDHPGRKGGTGGTAWIGQIPGTNAKEFQIEVERLKSGAFMTAIQQLRGMGALSNAEGQTATAAVAALDPSGTEEGFLKRLEEYEQIVNLGWERARNRTRSPTDAEAAPTVGSQPEKKRMKYNPATGEFE